METGTYTETKITPKIAGEAAAWQVANRAQKTTIVAISRPELDHWVKTELIWEPAIEMTPDDLQMAPPPMDDVILDPEEFYDSPHMEENIEVGEEGAAPLPIEEEQCEDFFQFACERMEIDFDQTQWLQLTRILGQFDSNEITLSEVPEEYRTWLKGLLEEFGWEKGGRDETYPARADIIYFIREGELDYEIDLGFLDRIRVNRNMGSIGQSKLVLNNNEIPLFVLPNLIQWRRFSLGILGDYLLRNQRKFLLSPNLRTGLNVICSDEQKSLGEYYTAVMKPKTNKPRKKQGEEWASHLLDNTFIKVPFQEEPLPGRFFFDTRIETLNVLKRVVAYQLARTGKTLSAPAMAVILKVLGVKDCKARNIRKTYIPELTNLFPGYEGLGAARISSDALAALISAVGKDMGLIDSDPDSEMIEDIWRTVGS